MNQRGFILPSPTMIMAGVILALSISNVIFVNLYRSTADEYAQFKADVSAQQVALAREAERAKAESERVNADTVAGLRASLERLRAGAGRITVRVPTDCNPASLRPVSTAAEGLDAATTERVVSAQQCEAIANNAVFDASQMMWLQDWVRKQHEVKP
jgi:hypothetical protein